MYNYARRGRGESGDTAPYAVQRELEDIAALIAVAGGSAHLFVSSGGMFALEAAAAGLQIERLAVYEVIASTIPHARRVILSGQGHVADSKIVASRLEQFFSG